MTMREDLCAFYYADANGIDKGQVLHHSSSVRFRELFHLLVWVTLTAIVSKASWGVIGKTSGAWCLLAVASPPCGWLATEVYRYLEESDYPTYLVFGN
jgi:hypothetical protein